MISVIINVIIVLGLAYTAFLAFITFIEMRKKMVILREHQLPPLSILKPLKGIDDQLEENLYSFFNLDYPKYELLFGINDNDDPAIEVVMRLQDQFPNSDAKLVIDNRKVGLNPKVNNLNNLYEQSKYHYLLISDSNIRVSAEYLQAMMSEYLNPNVGLVTSVFRGSHGRSLGSYFENLHLNSFIAANVFAVKRMIGKSITIGKSMLFSKDIIEKIKGFAALGEFLAEDHMLGLHIKKAGFDIRVSNHVIENINVNWSVDRFINRHLRWAKMRRTLNLFHYGAEPLSNPVMFALIGLLGQFNMASLVLFFTVCAIKTGLDILTAQFIGSDSKWYHYLLIPVKDILIGIIWLIPFIDKKIFWRGHWFKITKGTRLSPITG